MKLKTYETPEVDLLKISTEVNFCMSGEIPDMILDDFTIDWIF